MFPQKTITLTIVAVLLWTAGLVSAEVALRFSPADTTVEVGSIARLSVVVDDSLDLRTIEIYVEFDPTVVGSVSGGPGLLFTEPGFNLFQGFELSEPNVWHGYCVIMGANDYITDPGELYFWEFEGLANGVSPIVAVDVVLVETGSIVVPDVTLASTNIYVGDDLSAVQPVLSESLSLACFPNPFNPRTQINYTLPEQQHTCLSVYGLDGKLIKTLVNEIRSGGNHQDYWSGKDNAGRSQPSGVYLFHLEAGPYKKVQRVTLMK
ncbi:MAG: hypothetical protein GY780_05145 [bacterium]|nr:hypothetical protein [bacterium]